jgi:hypothetical protein
MPDRKKPAGTVPGRDGQGYEGAQEPRTNEEDATVKQQVRAHIEKILRALKK